MKNSIYTNGGYLSKKPNWHQEDSEWKAKNIFKIIDKHELTINTVCEVGCGAGEILNQLYSYLPENVLFEGYDISPQAYNISGEKQKDRLKFYLSDVINEGARISYDLVLCIDVFEHVEDYLGFLRKLKKLGKRFIFHIPLDLSILSLFRKSKLMSTRTGSGHLHYFNKDTALAALSDSGYSIQYYEYTKGSIELPRKTLKSKLIKYPRKILYSLSEDFSVKLLGGFSLMVLTE